MLIESRCSNDGKIVLEVEGRCILPDGLSGDVLLQNLASASPVELLDVARSLRGQFSILLHTLSCTVGITDLTGSYPLFKSSGLPGLLTTKWSVVEAFTDSELSPGGVAGLFCYGSPVGRFTMYRDTERVPGGKVIIVTKSGEVAEYDYADWPGMCMPQSISLEEAAEEFCQIAADYCSKITRVGEAVGVMLSGGNDSIFTAGTLHALKDRRMQAVTGDFAFKRYSEYAEAESNASSIGIQTMRVLLRMGNFLESFRTLNDAGGLVPIHSATSFVYHSLAKVLRSHGSSIGFLGDHADSLFLGFNEFTSLHQEIGLDRMRKMSLQERLAIVVREPVVTRSIKVGMRNLGVDPKIAWDELMNWHQQRYSAMRGCAEHCDLPTLQQLAGQLDGGLSFMVSIHAAGTLAQIGLQSIFYDPRMIRFALSLPLKSRLRYRTQNPSSVGLSRKWLGARCPKLPRLFHCESGHFILRRRGFDNQSMLASTGTCSWKRSKIILLWEGITVK